MYLLFILAAIQVGRAIPVQNESHLVRYENWSMGMPFQARCLMVPVLHWSLRSTTMIRLSQLLANSSTGPDQLMMQFVCCAAVLACGYFLLRMQRCFLPHPRFPQLILFLLVWSVAFTYAIRYESVFFEAWDLPGLFFFTLGLLACVESRAWLLILTIAVGTYNRETTVFLLPIWIACNQGLSRLKIYAVPVAGMGLWLAIKLQIRHWMHNAPSGLYVPTYNWRFLLFPHHWAQVASAVGFLIWPVIFFRKYAKSIELRRLWIGHLPLIGAMILLGWWNETRVFGELIPVTLLTACVELQTYLDTADGQEKMRLEA